jgi:hypothetical protein
MRLKPLAGTNTRLCTTVLMNDADIDPWYAEGMALRLQLEGRDFEVADAANLPDALGHFAVLAAGDPAFGGELREWLDYLLAGDDLCLMLALEQCCHEGVLLPWDMRAVRLADLPGDLLALLHQLLDVCPRHVMAHLAHYVYWLVRSERARRRGTPEWSSSLPKPHIEQWDDEPAFRPMRSRPRRWP